MNLPVLLIHDNPELFSYLHKVLEKRGVDLIGFSPRGATKPQGRGYALVAVESTFEGLPFLKGLSNNGMVMTAAPDKLKQNLLAWVDMQGRWNSKNGREPFLEDFVEKKLMDFVRKARANKGRNLYTLLIQEFEKPLITLTLKETGGNQLQAAQFLGLNRNTLRKKIRELHIKIVREKVKREHVLD